ncbi:hypothetical protein FCM35_KLT15679 [Carex littledalei]|uniref:Uncharacterized protein n=1 Tax=Carex littledalei TaxID=544730 RepID=A0A833RS08_9POAL|nr:hypothetical protein FCM35_KLT15679 [Carex littledalei]
MYQSQKIERNLVRYQLKRESEACARQGDDRRSDEEASSLGTKRREAVHATPQQGEDRRSQLNGSTGRSEASLGMI